MMRDSSPSITKHRGTSVYTNCDLYVAFLREALTMLSSKSRIEKKKNVASVENLFLKEGASLQATEPHLPQVLFPGEPLTPA